MAGAFAGLRPSVRIRAARWLPLVRGLALLLIVAALARPRIGDANALVPAQGIDIALSLDVSSSMTASKLGPNSRLEAMKEVVRNFIKGRENDRIGIVVFQRDALPLSPPSLDYKALDAIVAGLDTGILPDGTGIGVGLAAALNMLRDSTATSRVVILLTDGQHNAESISPEDAAELAAALRIRVYTIGLKTAEARPSRNDLDEDRLKAIADRTGGKYFTAASQADLAAVYAEIGTLETSRVGREHFERFTEIGPWLVLGAAGLIALEIVLRSTWLRRAPA
jgi:Ca-activated chloride channel family protein